MSVTDQEIDDRMKVLSAFVERMSQRLADMGPCTGEQMAARVLSTPEGQSAMEAMGLMVELLKVRGEL